MLTELDQGAAQHDRVKIYLSDISEGGTYISKGSGDRMRARNIYELFYEKLGEAGFKIRHLHDEYVLP